MKLHKITVKPNDTLWALAEKHTGDGRNWGVIFGLNAATLTEGEINPDRVGPNFIYPGDRLVVPVDVKFEASGN